MTAAKTSVLSATLLKSLVPALVSSAMDAIISVDENQRIVLFNTAAERMFQCSQQEALGRQLSRFIPERHRAAHGQHISNFGQAGGTVRKMGSLNTLYALRADGREFPVEVSISKVETGGNKIFTAILRDVTASKHAEQELRDREKYFRSLIEYASDLITLIDQNGVIHFQSPSIERVLGLKPENVEGRNIAEFIHPEDLPRLAAMIRRAFSNPDSPVSIECRIRHRDGSWRLFASVGRSIPHGTDGKKVVFNSRDITTNRDLEEQLLQAQKMEAIGTLAGGIAHDFNNMLAGILGSAELVREDLPPNLPTQEYVESIMIAANRARELVQQILTFSRRQESEKQPLQLQPIVGECIKLLRSTIPAMVKITHHVESGCPPVLADPTQIHQVIMNIATNAWQALPETGGHISISLRAVEVDATMATQHRELRTGAFVRLVIADNGHGMDAKTRERIFEPFFTTKPASKGSGLGLSVVYGIIKSHRGAIVVESELGRGTTFQIYFPASLGSRTKASTPAVAIPHGHGERILFVDDEPIVARSTEEFLKRLGYVVTCCEQSEDALARFRRAPVDFDMIITDWAMPGMSGTELVSAIREIRPDIPMLLMSGFVDSTLQHTAKTIGIGEILIKPVNPELLAQAVAQVLARGNRPGAGKSMRPATTKKDENRIAKQTELL
ncbi:MAG TPA: PAS domain S-box protein [Candidatus Acidoferrales bacterium]|nr:PAS domain S-box protein [Candidatus Acidoferrales bacterium]